MIFSSFEIKEVWETQVMVSLYGLEGLGFGVQGLGCRVGSQTTRRSICTYKLV